MGIFLENSQRILVSVKRTKTKMHRKIVMFIFWYLNDCPRAWGYPKKPLKFILYTFISFYNNYSNTLV